MRRERDALGVIAVLAVQVPEQEHQWKRERPEDHGSPCPDYEAASSPLGNSTGKMIEAIEATVSNVEKM